MKLKHQILFFLTGTIDYLKGREEAIFRPYSSIYGYFPDRSKSSIRRTIKNLLKSGNIVKIVEDGIPKFKITSLGKIKLTSEIPALSFGRVKWDGFWRMLIFDIPEKEKKLRDILRGRLKEFGFGKWQKSVYISPFDIGKEVAEFIKSHGLEEYAFILESKKILAGGQRELARVVWDLDNLQARYLELLGLCGELNTLLKRREVEKTKVKDLWQKLRDLHSDILVEDPGLPKGLLPPDWLREEAERLFNKISQTISQETERDQKLKN